MAQNLPIRAQALPERRRCIRSGQRFGEANVRPREHATGEQRQGKEAPLPRRHVQDQLADTRCNDRNDHEHRQRQRHDAGHRPTGDRIANHRHGNDPRARRCDPLREPRQQSTSNRSTIAQNREVTI